MSDEVTRFLTMVLAAPDVESTARQILLRYRASQTVGSKAKQRQQSARDRRPAKPLHGRTAAKQPGLAQKNKRPAVGGAPLSSA